MGLIHNFSLGSLVLKHNILASPLAGCSDYPFRKMFLDHLRPSLFFCEMVKMDPLVRLDPRTLHILDYSDDMHPIGAQIVGSSPQLAKESVRILQDMGFDLIDLNCGCPVDKVTGDGCGSALLKQPEAIGDILAAMQSVAKVPISVKIRMGWDEESIYADRITQIAEAAGAVSIAIHGRTRAQAYRGPARWESIGEAKKKAKTIAVIGNGDIRDGESAQAIFSQTNCDAILLSRATLGQPWIAEEIFWALQGKEIPPRSHEEKKERLMRHFERMCEYYPDRKVVIDMRRVACYYLKASAKIKELRHAFARAQDLSQVRALLKRLLKPSATFVQMRLAW